MSGRKVALGARWAALKHRPLRGSRDRSEDVVAPGVRDRAALKFAYESPVGYPALTPARVAPGRTRRATLKPDREGIGCAVRAVVSFPCGMPARAALKRLSSCCQTSADQLIPAFAPGLIEACARRAGPVAIEVHPVFAPGHIEARYR